jgi:hypothetical protein
MKYRRAILMSMTLAVTLPLPLWASAEEKITIPSETPTSMGEFLHRKAPPESVVGYLNLPANTSGPLPALILKHASGGLEGVTGENIRAWANSLNG